MARLLRGLAVMAILACVSALPAHAEKRVALVIGNAAYEHAPSLRNPKSDAEAISAKLEGLGFEVVRGTDLTYEGMRKTLRDYVYKLEGADAALLFYAGHGMQVNGRNYLIPVNAELKREADLEFEAVRLNSVLAHMEKASQTNLVFLDACRDNPLTKKLARSMGPGAADAVGRGLARVETGVGTLIAFATQPGNVALDGDGVNSPFTAGLLKHMETPGMDVQLVMRRVRQDVIAATGGTQVPWDNSSLTLPFVFKGGVAAQDKPPAGPATAPAASDHNASIELAFWKAANEQDTVQAYEIYLDRFPKGQFAPFARLRLEALGKAKDTPDKGTRLAAVEPAAQTPEPPADPRELTIALQTELKRVGCDPGAIDGAWGPNAKGALEDFAKHAGVKLIALEPSQDAIDLVKGKTDRVCPLVCSRLEVVQGDQCVAKTCAPGQVLSRTGVCVAVAERQAAPPPRPAVAPVRPQTRPRSRDCDSWNAVQSPGKPC